MAQNRKRLILKRLVVQVPADLLAAIDARADRLHNRSDVVREILARTLQSGPSSERNDTLSERAVLSA